MKNVAEETQERLRSFREREIPLDAKLARLNARIEKNRAALNRTNVEIELKIRQLSKKLGARRK